MKLIIDNKFNNSGNLATMIRQATDECGEPIGKAHRKSMLETLKFEVRLENGETDKIMANQIAANIYSQLDYEGREMLKFKVTTNHKKDGSARTKETGFTVLKIRHKKCKTTTCGRNVLVEWQDKTTTWMDLKYVKEVSPNELAEYAVANKRDD